MLVVAKLDGELNGDPDTDGNETGASDLGHDLLEVGDIVGGGNERGGPAEEGVDTSRVDNSVALSLLDGRTREGSVSRELLDGQGLSSEGGLVNLHGGLLLVRVVTLRHDFDVSRHNVAELYNDDVTRDKSNCVNCFHLAVSKTFCLRGQGCRQGLDGLVCA